MRWNIKSVWINIFTLLILVLFSACERKQVMEIGPLTLEQDTIWQGIVKVMGDIYVPPGVTLTVEPGTIIKFKRIDKTSDKNLFGTDSPYYPQAELIIRGKMIARGTPQKRIVFTSAEVDARPADWGAVNFLGSAEGNIIEYAKILFAYNGIHGHSSIVHVSYSEFAQNGVGISFKKEGAVNAPWFDKNSDFLITHNKFYRNKGGIGFRNSNAEISHNLIENNKFFGIFIKEKANAVISYNEITGNKKGIYLYQTELAKLEYNNIYDNKDYNIGVAEALDFDVEARHNWFGTINRKKIDKMIFDKQDDPSLGEVRYEPFLDKPVDWEGK